MIVKNNNTRLRHRDLPFDLHGDTPFRRTGIDANVAVSWEVWHLPSTNGALSAHLGGSAKGRKSVLPFLGKAFFTNW